MRRGFTILEVIVASGILAVGCLGVLGMLLTTINNNKASRLRTDAVIIAEQQLADMEACSLLGGVTNTTVLYGKIRDSQNATTWSHWRDVDSNGIPQTDTKRVYTIGYRKLPNNAGTNGNNYMRGAIRVTWHQSGQYSDICSKIETLDGMDKLGQRAGAYGECGFVTLPFAFPLT